MKPIDRFSKTLCAAFLTFLVCAMTARADEPLILFDIQKFEGHDWSKKPSTLSGYKFGKVDIKKNFTDSETGEQTPESLTWQTMTENERFIDDFKVTNKIKLYKDGYGGYEALFAMIAEGEKTFPMDTIVCEEQLEKLKRSFGQPKVVVDRIDSLFTTLISERYNAQWIKGKTAIDATCLALKTIDEANKALSASPLMLTFMAKPVESASKLTPIIGLNCKFEPSSISNLDGTMLANSEKVPGRNLKIKIDVDEKRVGPISGGVWDDNTKITKDRLKAKWGNEEKKLQFLLDISRLDGSSSFRVESPDMFTVQHGTCEKIDLKKKLF